jgi:hypothetical protein
MESKDFCYWLQGFFEIREASGSSEGQLSREQVEVIRRHLAMVFIHDIDPKAGPPEHQEVLQNVHDGNAGPTKIPGRVGPNGIMYRC